MKKTFAILVVTFGLASNAWAQIEIAGLKLGIPRSEAIESLRAHYRTVEAVQGSRYQVERRFVSATQPSQAYTLGDLPIREVNAFFNDDDLLSQVELKLDTARLEDFRHLIPQADQAVVDPNFGDTWEILRDDGEIVYSISALFDSATVSFADKAESSKNVVARRRSSERFKTLSNKIDNAIDAMKAGKR